MHRLLLAVSLIALAIFASRRADPPANAPQVADDSGTVLMQPAGVEERRDLPQAESTRQDWAERSKAARTVTRSWTRSSATTFHARANRKVVSARGTRN